MSPAPNRMMTALATVVVVGSAGAVCWFGAQAAAAFIEEKSQTEVGLALQSEGFDWTSVTTDGLQVHVAGTAPTEADRFRAMTTAARAVEPSRIVDDMVIAQREALEPPDFKLELLRNDAGISLIGLVPTKTDRIAAVRLLKNETAAPQVTDLMEAADYPVPAGWDTALNYGLRVAQMVPRAKISISPGAITLTAITDSPAEKARLQAEIARTTPDGIELTTEISAPRPVIAPFTLRFLSDADGTRFDACAADSDESSTAIVAAAVRAGASDTPTCIVGLGAPTPEWQTAAVAAIGAVAALGKGTVTISDADVALIAPADVPIETFDEVAARLETTLPPVFSLQSVHEQAEQPDRGPAEFSATVTSEGGLQMRGLITDDRMRDVVDSIARARFGMVDAALRTDPDVPGGWTVRVIGGLEAMAALNSGSLTVTPDLVRITGTSGDQQASDKTAAALSERLGAGAKYQMIIRYDRRLDPLLGLPTGQECVDRLNRTMSESIIGFEPNKSVIAGDPEQTLTALAEDMTDCGEFQIEVGGHTDSQGSDGFNADLSRSRAQAVLAAMTEDGIATANMTARGYGESQPIASNDTDAGREANRRIEFRLLSEMPVRNEPLPEPDLVNGVTADAPDPALQEDIAKPSDAAITTAAVRAGAIAMPGDPGAADVAGMQGPVMPSIAPSVVGAAESLPDPQATDALSLDDENATMPVTTADDNTPRPSPRPEDGVDSSTGEGGASTEE